MTLSTFFGWLKTHIYTQNEPSPSTPYVHFIIYISYRISISSLTYCRSPASHPFIHSEDPSLVIIKRGQVVWVMSNTGEMHSISDRHVNGIAKSLHQHDPVMTYNLTENASPTATAFYLFNLHLSKVNNHTSNTNAALISRPAQGDVIKLHWYDHFLTVALQPCW